MEFDYEETDQSPKPKDKWHSLRLVLETPHRTNQEI